MLSVLIAILFASWALGLFFGVTNSVIHILLILAVLAFAVKLFEDIRAII